MVNIGIIGFGFIGRMHLTTLRKLGLAQVTAVADKDPANLSGSSSTVGNIAMDDAGLSLEGVQTFEDGEALLESAEVDAVLITLPTYLHTEYVVKALQAGKHVICEKPLVRSSQEGDRLLEALAATDRHLYVAQCIRFWPAYEKAREIVKSGEHGRVLNAHFQRTSPKPTWSGQNWLLEEDKSGGCLLDLHLHDVDYVRHLLGDPENVTAQGVVDEKEGVGDVLACYQYANGVVTSIEGGWNHPSAYPFRMAFRIVLEGAALEFNTLTDGRLHVYAGGNDETPDLDSEDGYCREHRHFIACMEAGRASDRVTPEDALASIRLIERERALIG